MLIVVMAAAPAFAQTGYPPTTDGGGPEVDVRNYGVVRPGQEFQKEDCGFAPGSAAGVSFNGGSAGSVTVGGDGCARLDVEVIDRGTVSIDGRRYSTQCGRQVITVDGITPGGGERVAQNTFTVPCVEAARGEAGGGGLSDTGANVTRWLLVAGSLVLLGAALVVADRRRGRSTSV